LKATLP